MMTMDRRTEGDLGRGCGGCLGVLVLVFLASVVAAIGWTLGTRLMQ